MGAALAVSSLRPGGNYSLFTFEFPYFLILMPQFVFLYFITLVQISNTEFKSSSSVAI